MEIMVAGQRVTVPEIKDAAVEPIEYGTPGPDGLPDFVVGDDGGQAAMVSSGAAPAQQFAPDVGTPMPAGPMPSPETFSAPALPAENYMDNGYLDYDPRQAQWSPGNPYRNVEAQAVENRQAIRVADERPSAYLDGAPLSGDVARTGEPMHRTYVSGMQGDHNPAHAWAQEQTAVYEAQQNEVESANAQAAAAGLYSDDDPLRDYSLADSVGRTQSVSGHDADRDNCHTWGDAVNGLEGLGGEPSTLRTIIVSQRAARERERSLPLSRRRGKRERRREYSGPLPREFSAFASQFWWYAGPATIGSPVPGVVFAGTHAVDRSKVGMGRLSRVGTVGWVLLSHFPVMKQREAADVIIAIKGTRADLLRHRFAFKSRRRVLPARPVRLPVVPTGPWTGGGTHGATWRTRIANVKAAWSQVWWTRPNVSSSLFAAAATAAAPASAPPPAPASAPPDDAPQRRAPTVSPWAGRSATAKRGAGLRAGVNQRIMAQQGSSHQFSLRGMGDLGSFGSMDGWATDLVTRISDPSSLAFMFLIKNIQTAYGLPSTGMATPQTIKVIRASIALGSREGKALAKIFYFPSGRHNTRADMLAALRLYDPRSTTRVTLLSRVGKGVMGVNVQGMVPVLADALTFLESSTGAYMDKAGFDKNFLRRTSAPAPGSAEKALVQAKDGARRNVRMGGSSGRSSGGSHLPGGRKAATSVIHKRVAIRTLNKLAAKVSLNASGALLAARKPGTSPAFARALLKIAARNRNVAQDLVNKAGAIMGGGGAPAKDAADVEEIVKDAVTTVSDGYEKNSKDVEEYQESSPPMEQGEGSIYEDDYELPGGMESVFGGVDPKIQAAIDAENARDDAIDDTMWDDDVLPEMRDDLEPAPTPPAASGGMKKALIAVGAGLLALEGWPLRLRG